VKIVAFNEATVVCCKDVYCIYNVFLKQLFCSVIKLQLEFHFKQKLHSTDIGLKITENGEIFQCEFEVFASKKGDCQIANSTV